MHCFLVMDGVGSVGSKGCWRGLLPWWWWMGGSSPIQGVGFMELLVMEGVERGMDGGKITLWAFWRSYLVTLADILIVVFYGRNPDQACALMCHRHVFWLKAFDFRRLVCAWSEQYSSCHQPAWKSEKVCICHIISDKKTYVQSTVF